MTVKEELIPELEQVPEAELAKVLEFVRSGYAHAALYSLCRSHRDHGE